MVRRRLRYRLCQFTEGEQKKDQRIMMVLCNENYRVVGWYTPDTKSIFAFSEKTHTHTHIKANKYVTSDIFRTETKTDLNCIFGT